MNAGRPELDALLQRKVRHFEAFRHDHEDVWTVVGSGYRCIRLLSLEVASHCVVLPIETHRMMMWYTTIEYQMESFFLALDRKVGEALALLRMAAELARDVRRIGDDQQRLEMWLGRRDEGNEPKQYRKVFRFDDSDPVEKYVHQLYDLASTLGVHGHLETTSRGEAVDVTADGRYIRVEVPEEAVFEALHIWVAALFPVNELCRRGFTRNLDAIREAQRLYLQMYDAFGSLAKSFRSGANHADEVT